MIISNLNDTICAISTPAGTGGIAVVRLSGTLAIDVNPILLILAI